MDRISKRNLLIFTLLLSLCVGGLGYVLITGDRQVERTDKWVDHTNQVILEAEKLSTLIEGMVSTQRGFLLTGDINFQIGAGGRRFYRDRKNKPGNGRGIKSWGGLVIRHGRGRCRVHGWRPTGILKAEIFVCR